MCVSPSLWALRTNAVQPDTIRQYLAGTLAMGLDTDFECGPDIRSILDSNLLCEFSPV